ncbi:MAG: DUF2752 domain-containing protein [Verrucomicrobia bacterium]|nr:DUF2752 domain-containing protein [Cytophagales bacterium]
MFLQLTDWLEDNMLACPFKKYLGVDCPGCGLQRSVVALLRGDFSQSFKMYPATIPLLIMLVFLALHLKFEFKHGAETLKWMFITVISISTLNFILKLL